MATQTDLAELDGGPLEVPPSIFAHLEPQLRSNPDGIAAIIMHQAAAHLSEFTSSPNQDPVTLEGEGAKSCLIWTRAQLHRAGLRFAAGLMARGVQPGMRIATMIPNGMEYYLILWTCQLLRLTLCSLDLGALTAPRRAELGGLLRRLKPEVVVVPGGEGAGALDQAVEDVGSLSPSLKIVLEGEAGEPWVPISRLAVDGHERPVDAEELMAAARNDDPERIALILFTSGTSSGNPKGCPRTVSCASSFLAESDWGTGLSPTTRALATTANFRIIAPFLALSAFQKGAALVMPAPVFVPHQVLSAIQQHRVTHVLFVPALLHIFAADPAVQAAGGSVEGVESFSLGGDVITQDLFVKAQATFPRAQINAALGMTEGGGLVRWPYFGASLEQIPFFGGVSPLGVVRPGARLVIRDHITGEIKRRGEPGELCVNSGTVLKHYLEHAHEDSFVELEGKEGRWFKTGDLGMINRDGIVYVLGRIKDVIKRAGVPITPAGLESCIEQLVGSQTSVIAYPDPTYGQVPFAVVRDLKSFAPDDIKDHVIATFGKDYALGEIVSLESLGLEAFPLNATGKVMKLDLLKAIQDSEARRKQQK